MANSVLSTNLSAETREEKYLFDLHQGNQADKNYHPQRSHGLESLQLGDRRRNLFPVHCGLYMLRQEVCLKGGSARWKFTQNQSPATLHPSS